MITSGRKVVGKDLALSPTLAGIIASGKEAQVDPEVLATFWERRRNAPGDDLTGDNNNYIASVFAMNPMLMDPNVPEGQKLVCIKLVAVQEAARLSADVREYVRRVNTQGAEGTNAARALALGKKAEATRSIPPAGPRESNPTGRISPEPEERPAARTLRHLTSLTITSDELEGRLAAFLEARFRESLVRPAVYHCLLRANYGEWNKALAPEIKKSYRPVDLIFFYFQQSIFTCFEEYGYEKCVSEECLAELGLFTMLDDEVLQNLALVFQRDRQFLANPENSLPIVLQRAKVLARQRDVEQLTGFPAPSIVACQFVNNAAVQSVRDVPGALQHVATGTSREGFDFEVWDCTNSGFGAIRIPAFERTSYAMYHNAIAELEHRLKSEKLDFRQFTELVTVFLTNARTLWLRGVAEKNVETMAGRVERAIGLVEEQARQLGMAVQTLATVEFLLDPDMLQSKDDAMWYFKNLPTPADLVNNLRKATFNRAQLTKPLDAEDPEHPGHQLKHSTTLAQVVLAQQFIRAWQSLVDCIDPLVLPADACEWQKELWKSVHECAQALKGKGKATDVLSEYTKQVDATRNNPTPSVPPMTILLQRVHAEWSKAHSEHLVHQLDRRARQKLYMEFVHKVVASLPVERYLHAGDEGWVRKWDAFFDLAMRSINRPQLAITEELVSRQFKKTFPELPSVDLATIYPSGWSRFSAQLTLPGFPQDESTDVQLSDAIARLKYSMGDWTLDRISMPTSGS